MHPDSLLARPLSSAPRSCRHPQARPAPPLAVLPRVTPHYECFKPTLSPAGMLLRGLEMPSHQSMAVSTNPSNSPPSVHPEGGTSLPHDACNPHSSRGTGVGSVAGGAPYVARRQWSTSTFAASAPGHFEGHHTNLAVGRGREGPGWSSKGKVVAGGGGRWPGLVRRRECRGHRGTAVLKWGGEGWHRVSSKASCQHHHLIESEENNRQRMRTDIQQSACSDQTRATHGGGGGWRRSLRLPSTTRYGRVAALAACPLASAS